MLPIKKILSAIILTTALLLSFYTGAVFAAEPYVIDALDMKMIVRDDNSYLVTETYSITFNEKRHGIEREIPLIYLGAPGTVRGVEVDGAPFTAQREGWNYLIRIGDPNKYADRNTKYVLRYVYDVGGDHLRNKDEFCYNLGAEWDVTLKKITFSIEMPHPFNASDLNFTQGERGSAKNDATWFKVEGNTIRGQAKSAIKPGELLTIALPLPDGYFTTAVRKWNVGTVINDFWWLWAILLEITSILLWVKLGKNRRIFPSVQFYPPEGVTPAEIGYIIDGKADPMDIISLIIYWAGKGCLDITEITQKTMLGLSSKKGFSFRKLREPDEDAKAYEKKMFKEMFALGENGEVTSFALEEGNFYTTLDSAASEVKKYYDAKKETRLYDRGVGWRRLLVGLPSFGLMALVGFVPTFSATGDVEEASVMAFVAELLTIFLWFFAFLASGWRTATRRGKNGIAAAVLALPLIIIAGTVINSLGSGTDILPLLFTIGAIFLGIVPIILPIILSFKCTRRTELGDRYMESALGFKGFLAAAERDKINLLVEQNPSYFYDILPYAVALGVTDKWARNFEHIAEINNPPEWYHGTDQFRAAAFSSGLSGRFRSMADSVESSRPAPKSIGNGKGSTRSGGSFGGGSAGSGAGGGRGRSW